jgi:hypothetical protein
MFSPTKPYISPNMWQWPTRTHVLGADRGRCAGGTVSGRGIFGGRLGAGWVVSCRRRTLGETVGACLKVDSHAANSEMKCCGRLDGEW